MMGDKGKKGQKYTEDDLRSAMNGVRYVTIKDHKSNVSQYIFNTKEHLFQAYTCMTELFSINAFNINEVIFFFCLHLVHFPQWNF